MGWRDMEFFGQSAGGRPSKHAISRDAGLVGVHWPFGVQTKGSFTFIDNGQWLYLISGWLIRRGDRLVRIRS